MWMLCVVLHLQSQKTCWPTPGESQCRQIQRDWMERSYAWSQRSKLPPAFLSVCEPPETGRELTARERPPR
jgi:hypothetical protein